MISDIFISYNRQDCATAQHFAEGFKREGFSVWWDQTLKSGEAFDEVIEQELKIAKAVVVLWSPRSVVSRWVRAEATIADRCKTLAPVVIEACERPIMFELTQTAELGHWHGDAGDLAWQAFLSDVRGLVTKRAPASAVSPPSVRSQKGARPALAVLPFTNRSGLKEDDTFAIGMVVDIIDALSVSRTLKVLASGSTAAYRKNAVDVADIGRALGVRYLMEGNIRRVDDSLRVTAQLIEAERGTILWTQKFDRPLAELAQLQEDLVIEVATHLGSQIMRREVEQALKKPSDITSYEARIRSTIAATRADWAGATAEAERAVALAPDDGACHACLAFALSGEIMSGSEDPSWWARVQTHITKALALDPAHGYVQMWVGWAYAWSGRPAEGLPFVENAVALNQNNSTARHARGALYASLGRFDEALDEFRAVEALSPQSPTLYNLVAMRALAHLAQGWIDPAIADLDLSLRMMPNFAWSLVMRVGIAAMVNNTMGARQALLALRSLQPSMDRDRSLRVIQRWMSDKAQNKPVLLAAFAKAWDEFPMECAQ